MNNKNKSRSGGLPAPAFQVQWEEGNTQGTETIYWSPSHNTLPELRSRSKLRNALASLHTDSTHVEVSDMDWSTATTVRFTPNRVGFSALVSSSASIQYGYADEKRLRTTTAGRILFFLPGREILAHMTSGRLCTVTCTFDTDYAENIIGPVDQLSHTRLHDVLDLRSSLISTIMLRLMDEALYPGPISQAVAESFGHALLTECAHWLKSRGSNPDTGNRLSVRELQTIEHYLANISGKAPSVADLAAACGFSERYFAKLFRELTGMAVSHYIKGVQLSKAKALLLETELPLKEIAYRLGYSTAANFSASFRVATGTTPGQYRKSN